MQRERKKEKIKRGKERIRHRENGRLKRSSAIVSTRTHGVVEKRAIWCSPRCLTASSNSSEVPHERKETMLFMNVIRQQKSVRSIIKESFPSTSSTKVSSATTILKPNLTQLYRARELGNVR